MTLKDRKSGRKLLRFERLEGRQMLAGNVLLSVSDHTLFITGDAEANDIVITQTGKKDFTISSGANATTLNGAVGPLSFSKVKRVQVSMGAGADVVTVTGDRLRKMDIDMGADNDTLNITANRTRKTTINMGAGNDQATITASRIREKMNVNMGDGTDTLTFGNAIPRKGTLDGGTKTAGSSTLNTPGKAIAANGRFHHLNVLGWGSFG
jgi:hypothetical protein